MSIEGVSRPAPKARGPLRYRDLDADEVGGAANARELSGPLSNVLFRTENATCCSEVELNGLWMDTFS